MVKPSATSTTTDTFNCVPWRHETYVYPVSGWRCPQCGAVYSPFVFSCPRCSNACGYPLVPGTGPAYTPTVTWSC